MSVFILFHCNIHARLFSFSCFLLVCLINFKKKPKKLVVVYFFAVGLKKRKPKNISRSSFACWELSRVNSFYFFSFLWGSRRPYLNCWSGSYMHDYLFNLEPILLVFSCLLNACRFQLSPMHVHSYYYTHRLVVQVKGNNDDIWWTYRDEKS